MLGSIRVVHGVDDLRGAVRLWSGLAVTGDLMTGETPTTGRQDHLDIWQELVDPLRQGQAAHRSGHVDVGEEHPHSRPFVQDKPGLFRMARLRHGVTRSSRISTAIMRTMSSSSTTRITDASGAPFADITSQPGKTVSIAGHRRRGRRKPYQL
jgi:hypothetical protein